MKNFKQNILVHKFLVQKVDTYGDHLALGGHVRRAVGQSQLGLQSVEVGL